MMAAVLIASQLATAVPNDFIRAVEAAPVLRYSERHVRRLCEENESAGLSKKDAGEWWLKRSFDSRLVGIESREDRDVRQVEELQKEGTPAEDIELARRKVFIVRGLDSFEAVSRNGIDRLTEYRNKLLADHVIGAGCKIRKLKARTLRDWRDRYRQPGDAGGLAALVRERPAQAREGSIGSESWDFFLGVRHSGNRLSVSEAFDQTLGYIIEKNLRDDPAWKWPALRTVQLHYANRVPIPVRIMADEGPHKFRAKCLPKVRRSYSHVAAGEVVCGDQRTLDFFIKVAGEREPRRIRPKLTAWLDVRSRKFVGWYIGEDANSDTILSTLKSSCLSMGTVPARAIIDNGQDYMAVGGKTRGLRKWDEFDPKHVQTAFERLEIVPQYALVKHPWSKMIESHFRSVAEGFDRFVPSYVGGEPGKRPWDSEDWSKLNIHQLWTLDQVREHFEQFLVAHHAKPQRGDGMDGLSPDQAFTQFFTTTPRRVPNADTLALLISRLKGPIKVSQNGVRLDKLDYGKWDESVFALQGRSVYVAVDPVEAGRVILCEQDGTPITIANLDRNTGATREEVRDAERTRRRSERKVKEAVAAREYLVQTPHSQIQQRRKLAAESRQLPPSQLPERRPTESIKIVRPEVAVAVEKIKKVVGAEAMKRLSENDSAAEAVNRTRRPSFRDLPEPEETGTKRLVAPNFRDLVPEESHES